MGYSPRPLRGSSPRHALLRGRALVLGTEVESGGLPRRLVQVLRRLDDKRQASGRLALRLCDPVPMDSPALAFEHRLQDQGDFGEARDKARHGTAQCLGPSAPRQSKDQRRKIREQCDTGLVLVGADHRGQEALISQFAAQSP